MSDNTNKAKEFIKKHKKPIIIAGVAYAVFMFAVIALVIGIIFSDDSGDSTSYQPTDYSTVDDTSNNSEPTQEAIDKPEQESTKVRYSVSENAAEHFCQDAGLLNGYVDSSKISIIYASNYNKRYTDSFSYDKNGNSIKFIQWNGKSKSSGEAVGFTCWVSGSSDSDITLHRLVIDGNIVYGEVFESYREDGSPIN